MTRAAALAWAQAVLATRERSLATYAPDALRDQMRDEQDRTFTVDVPLGTLRALVAAAEVPA